MILGIAIETMRIAPLLASLAFAYVFLGYQELQSRTTGEQRKQQLSPSVALPMTLNNLAGGVAGGAARIQASVAFLYAFLASLIAMSCGHWNGTTLVDNTSTDRKYSSEVVAASLFFLLSLMTLYEAIR
jgi:putative Mn2+ efflux pump MntP